MSGVTLPSLEELTFGLEFNQSLSNLPSSLKILSLGHYFEQSLQDLPSSLQELRFNQFHIRIHDMKHRAEG